MNVNRVAPVLSDKSLRAEFTGDVNSRVNDVRVRRRMLIKESDRTKLVFKYFGAVPKGFTHPELIANVQPSSPFLAMFGMASSDPFYAVVSTRCH